MLPQHDNFYEIYSKAKKLNITWPHGARMAIALAGNLEAWTEIPDPRHRRTHHVGGSNPIKDDDVISQYDCRTASENDYGGRTGVWRILRILDKYGVKASFNTNALCILRYPEAVKAVHERGHEIVGHSYAEDIQLTQLTDEQERRLLDDYRAAQALTTFTSQQSAIEADERYGPVPRTTRNASMKLNMRLEACALRMDSSRLYARRRGRTIRLRRSTSVDGLKLTVEKQEKLRALAARAVMAVRETARVGERTVAKAVDARREAAELRRVAKRPATPLWIVEERKRPKGPTALPQTDDEKRQEIENVKSVEAQQSQDLFTMWKKAAGLDPDVEPDDSPYEIQDDSDETILIEEEDDSLQCAQRVESELDISCEEDMIPDTPPDEDYLESVRAEMLEEELLVAEWLEARDALKREAEKLKRQEDVVRDARRRVAELEAKVKRMDAARSEKRDYDPLDEIEAALRG